MNNIEDYFSESITKYQVLEREASALADDIEKLEPDAILLKCSELSDLQKDISENDSRLFEVIDFVGPSVLDNPYTGEYQRALQRAIDASNRVASKAKTIRALLKTELNSLRTNINGIGNYSSGNKKKGGILRSEM